MHCYHGGSKRMGYWNNTSTTTHHWLNDWKECHNVTHTHTHTHNHLLYARTGRGRSHDLYLLKAHTELAYANMVPLTDEPLLDQKGGRGSFSHALYIYIDIFIYIFFISSYCTLNSGFILRTVLSVFLKKQYKYKYKVKCCSLLWEQGLTKVKFLCLLTQTSPIKMILTVIMQWDHDAVLSSPWANQILVLLSLGVAVNACFPIMAQ